MENNEVQPQEAKQESPQESAPVPETPKSSGLKTYLTVFGYVVVAALFAYAGFAYRDYVKGDIVETDKMAATDVMKEGEKDTSDAIPVAEDKMVKGEGLEVAWRDAIKDNHASWFKQYQRFGYDAFENPESQEGVGDELNVDYYHIGQVKEEGPYKDYIVYMTQVECEGPCFTTPTFRFLRKSDDLFLLAEHSEPDLTYFPGEYTVLEGVKLQGLSSPEEIAGPDGEKLVLHSERDAWFPLTDRRVAFHSTSVGDVYVEKDDAVFRRNGFYVRRPDGTEAVYTVEVPFFEDESTIPAVTWNDGQENTFDYLKADVGGCGLTNLASVLDSDMISLETDLMQTGTTANGDPVYEFRDSKHEVLKSFYDGFHVFAEGEEKLPYEEYVASHPIFVWVDDLGRMLKFQRSAYIPPVECGKPVIYLYPEQEMDVSVKVEPVGGFSFTEPEYGEGWNVTAKPDGTLTNHADGETYPYLFWEGRGGLYETPSEGYIVAQGEVEGFLNDMLARYGLNEQETADFTEFWLPRMQASPHYFVTFMTNRVMDELAPLTVEPKPDSVFRILMDYRPLEAPIDVLEPRAPHAFERNGFTVVEWGGVLGREAAQH